MYSCNVKRAEKVFFLLPFGPKVKLLRKSLPPPTVIPHTIQWSWIEFTFTVAVMARCLQLLLLLCKTRFHLSIKTFPAVYIVLLYLLPIFPAKCTYENGRSCAKKWEGKEFFAKTHFLALLPPFFQITEDILFLFFPCPQNFQHTKNVQ